MIFIKSKIAILIVVFLNIFFVSVHAEAPDEDKIIKVGVYECEPYFMVDTNGYMSGYYYDLMNLLQKMEYFEYEFVIDTLDGNLKKLADGEIDIMMGVSMETQLEEGIILNRYRTNKEILGVFSDGTISFENLYSAKRLKLGVVEGDVNAEMVLDLFKANQIDVSIVYEKDYKTLDRLLKENKIDLLVHTKWKEKDYFLVYEFIGRDLYIAGHKGSQAILNKLDQAIDKTTLEKENPIALLYEQYFGEAESLDEKITIGIVSMLFLILAICIFPLTHKKMIKNKIQLRMNNNQYILQYQPIYNPRNNTIVGFEGLLRLLGKNNKLIPPAKFIPEIEKNNMLFEVSIWIIEKVIDDYNEIKKYVCMSENDFYLSLNISLKEIENDDFVDRAIRLLKESNLGHQKICLEIIERFKMNDEDKIAQNIRRLKQAGFKLAIDDFGVEYSNLDIFQKLDVDIIKVDKMLVDGIGKDAIKEEIILFISRLADIGNRFVVLEGIEEASQDTKIKEMENDRLYVQGYYYNKPMYKKQIKTLNPNT